MICVGAIIGAGVFRSTGVGIFAVSVVALSFGQYVSVIFSAVPIWASALGASAFFAGINLINAKVISKAKKYFVYVMIVVLLRFIVEGIPKVDVSRLDNFFE